VRSPPSGLNDSTVKPAFFIAPAINPRNMLMIRRERILTTQNRKPK
jgi:hypothetical protein